jgi:hypothetical protein
LREGDSAILDPLRTHKWVAAIEREFDDGLIIAVERGGHRHNVALIYTSATDNKVYKSLAAQVEHIFFNGEPYRVQDYAFGLDKPVSSADDFHSVLVEWNKTSAEGKFVPERRKADTVDASTPQHRLLLSEEPIEAIRLRIRQLQSVRLAKKLIERRAATDRVGLEPSVIQSKAEGVAYTLRNASDYFQAKEGHNVSQRVLNLYYGSLAFAFAEMLAAPRGSKALAEIENSTKLGHGLYTVDGCGDGLEQIVVGVFSGFFPIWAASMGLPISDIPQKKVRRYGDLASCPDTSWLSIETLFASIPEVADLFADIFEGKPQWVRPAYDQMANAGLSMFGQRATRSYLQLIDSTGRLTKEDIALFPGPISEIGEVASEAPGRHFRVAIDHPGKQFWWEALRIHHSPFERDASYPAHLRRDRRIPGRIAAGAASDAGTASADEENAPSPARHTPSERTCASLFRRRIPLGYPPGVLSSPLERRARQFQCPMARSLARRGRPHGERQTAAGAASDAGSSSAPGWRRRVFLVGAGNSAGQAALFSG